MAVYTEVSDEALEDFIESYDIGDVVSCKGIAEGVENSNYLLQTDRDSYILTLYEKRVHPEELPFFLGLMEHLAKAGFPSPTPIHDRKGKVLRDLCDRPAAIVSFLAGMWPRRATPSHCHQVGIAAARLHLTAQGFDLTRKNQLSLDGWGKLVEQTEAHADEVQPGLAGLIRQEFDTLSSQWPTDLPSGIIHADMFPDNVFFRHDTLSGVIDFYFACNDFMAYDLAVCLNAWCFEADGSFNITKARRLINGYNGVRALKDREVAALPLLARGAALRFLLTRLFDWLNHPEGAFVKRKDPLEYLAKLKFHQGVTGPAGYGLDARDTP
jgi:homoserine kinase type II